MRYALKQVNEDPSKLYNVTIGYRIVDTCSNMKILRSDISSMILAARLVGVVGPASSDEAVLASSAFGIFGKRLISYSATAIDLIDREKYFNFYRTVPSDDMQVMAIRDILLNFQWRYISTVNSYGDYGQQGINYLVRLLAPSGVCIATRNGLPKTPNSSDYDIVIKSLKKDKNAKVVVLFTTAEDTYGIFRAARKWNVSFVWLSSSAWPADYETIMGVEKIAKGSILLNYAGINNNEFLKYFKALKLKDNNYKWFADFWEDNFNCTRNNTAKPTRRQCSGNESIAESKFYGQYAAAQAVIDAVNVYAYALRCTFRYFCSAKGINKTQCALNISNRNLGSGLQFYIRNWSRYCTDVFGRVPFDSNGSYYRDIEILNFDGKSYSSVGLWKLNVTNQESSLEISSHLVTWNDGARDPPDSVCSKPCKAGYRKVQSKTKECCFTCHACNGDEILVNNTCIKCAKFELPNQNVTACTKLAKLRVKLSNHLSIIVVVESTIGIILNTLVLFLFIKHRESKVVKSSSRELSFFMLAGLYLCFISPCTFLLQPTLVRCGLRRFIFGLSLTACYTPLMLKTNRIYRIFKAARNMGSMPYLVSPASQIWICFGLLAIQLLLSVMWVVGDPPVVSHVLVSEYKMVADLCGADIFTIAINLVPCFCMLAASTVYAFKSRKFPKNYNEAFNIGATMYVSCVLWAIFIPLLLLLKVENTNPFSDIFLIANFTNIIGLVSLAGLFGPKVYRLFSKKASKACEERYSSTYNKTNSVNNSLENSIDMIVMTKTEEEKKVLQPSKKTLIPSTERCALNDKLKAMRRRCFSV